jgi:N-acetyl-anhydromuramyl-L-alanine amidase AmpD
VTHPTKPFALLGRPLKEPRQGVMLHYDVSVSDESSIAWFTDPDCKAGYNFIVMDSGNIIPIVALDKRAPHAGWCAPDGKGPRYRDANSAFYGVAIAATVGDVATVEQKRSVAALCLRLFSDHGWPITDVWRIVSHRSQAVYEPGHPKAGQRGRKKDPEGPDLAHPVMNTNEIRGMVAARQVAA